MIDTWRNNYKINKEKGNFILNNTKPIRYLVNNCFYKRLPIVVVGAGPSLDYNINLLKQYKNNCLIICVDVVLPRLLLENILPDFVVTIDPSELIHKYWVNGDKTNLVCPTTTNPKTIEDWNGNIFLYNQIDFKGTDKGTALADIIQHTAFFGSFPNRYFVGATAVQLASIFYPSVIILIGYDFSYRDKNAYCNNVLDYRVTINRSLDDLKKAAYIADDTINGFDTSKNLLFYKNVFINVLRELNLKVINSTEGGLLEINNLPLNKSLEMFCKQPIKKIDVSKNKKRKRRKK